ncbi:hypothetical protein ROV86_19290 [Stenotrophomonas pavanii]|uniref:hypothetical protein n=1 Tax=Stenotrophomonas pavanii TaxID=487698 RepID=UPI002894FEB7|nr:hypothetical protein [Stenotrophomonas pavanii]MDT3530247.1 hypothetical protein [Stenotrophomonas pavanii]
MNTDDQTKLARSIGRDVAQERALLALIGSPRRNEPAAMVDILKMNFEMGRTELQGRLIEANLPDNLYRTSEDEFRKVKDAILDGVRNGKYQVPAR